MNEATLTEGRQDVSARNPYALAGWLALAQAVLYPVGIFLAVVGQIIGQEAFNYRGPVIGPGDGLLILFTIFAVYTIWKLKVLLNERHGFHALDTPVHLLMAWIVLSQIVTLSIDGFAMLTGLSTDSPFYVISSLGLFVVFMITAGILHIVIGMRLLRAKSELGDPIRLFGIIALIAGILEATVFLSPLAALIVPISCVMLAMVFLKDSETADFV